MIDFGQNMAGTVRVEVHADAGEKISFEHGEMLDAEGNFIYAFTDSTREQKDVYISAGKRGEVFEPEFTYHGFRYVRVTGGERLETGTVYSESVQQRESGDRVFPVFR